MAQTTFKSREDIISKVGGKLGTSDWVEITQDRINLFADATDDHQWIHVDIEKAKQGPFGGPIAHGFLTLSLGPSLIKDVIAVEGAKMGINYGLNKVRFTNPVPVGSKVRLHVTLSEAKEVEPNGIQSTYDIEFEIDGQEKPACVAQWISRTYF